MADVNILRASGESELSEQAGNLIVDGDKIYKVVKNAESSTALANGDVVIYDGTADDGYSVKLTASASAVNPAGVIIEAITAGKYGKMLVYGVHTACKVDGGTTDVAADTAVGTGSANGYAYTTTTLATVVGVTLAAVTTKTTGTVFVKTL